MRYQRAFIFGLCLAVMACKAAGSPFDYAPVQYLVSEQV